MTDAKRTKPPGIKRKLTPLQIVKAKKDPPYKQPYWLKAIYKRINSFGLWLATRGR